MNKKSFIASLIVILIFISLILLRNALQKDLKRNGILVKAKVIRANFGGKVGGGFQCLIEYHGKSMQLPSSSSILKGRLDFVGKTFPAMYLPNEDLLEILITPKDFEKFNIPFPDSLNWVIPYVH